MKFFTLEEILEERLQDPEFQAGFEVEKRVLAAERAEKMRPRFALMRNKPTKKVRGYPTKLQRKRATA